MKKIRIRKMANTHHTCLIEEKLSAVVGTISQEEFQKQEQKMHNISSGITEITKKESN